MLYVWWRNGVRTGLWWRNLKERGHLEDLGIYWDNIKVNFKEIVIEAWIGLIWLRIGTSGRPL
jgi:hypothetical protein